MLDKIWGSLFNSLTRWSLPIIKVIKVTPNQFISTWTQRYSRVCSPKYYQYKFLKLLLTEGSNNITLNGEDKNLSIKSLPIQGWNSINYCYAKEGHEIYLEMGKISPLFAPYFTKTGLSFTLLGEGEEGLSIKILIRSFHNFNKNIFRDEENTESSDQQSNSPDLGWNFIDIGISKGRNKILRDILSITDNVDLLLGQNNIDFTSKSIKNLNPSYMVGEEKLLCSSAKLRGSIEYFPRSDVLLLLKHSRNKKNQQIEEEKEDKSFEALIQDIESVLNYPKVNDGQRMRTIRNVLKLQNRIDSKIKDEDGLEVVKLQALSDKLEELINHTMHEMDAKDEEEITACANTKEMKSASILIGNRTNGNE